VPSVRSSNLNMGSLIGIEFFTKTSKLNALSYVTEY